MSFCLFENVIDKMCLEIIYLIYMYKKGLALNSLQRLICHGAPELEFLFGLVWFGFLI